MRKTGNQYRVRDVEHRYVSNRQLSDVSKQEYIILYLKDAASIQPPSSKQFPWLEAGGFQ